MKRIMALCEGRHPIPGVSDSVFSNTLNPLDVKGLEEEAERKLSGISDLDLYVTGLTVALVAVINTCRRMGVNLVLYHYDRESGNYYPQSVL